MACALYFFAHGCPMHVVGDVIGVSKATAARAVDDVTEYFVSQSIDMIQMSMDQ